ncbi:MAG: LPS export ABC transporter periplasmic protein LptC [Elusimicrobiaceae bacterium]|nr:LPS export ABC transporter periplasmic protein LptC [Elusimicrobiaceae bacterium]
MRKLLFIAPVLLCAGCMDTSGGSSSGTLTQEIRGLKMYEFRSGRTEWMVTAKRALLDDATESAELLSPEVEIRKNGKLSAHIKSDKGSMDIAKKIVTLLENVNGVSEKEKVSLKTSRLDFDIPGDRIWTDSPITLVQSGVKIRGQGFSARSDLAEIEIKKQETSLPEGINPADIAKK